MRCLAITLWLCAVPYDNCDIRERGSHEDAKHKDDDGGTVALEIGILHR